MDTVFVANAGDSSNDLNVYISGLALLVSFFAYLFSRKSAKAEIRPVLVFVYNHKSGWLLVNIGKGPALNVIVAQRQNGTWFNPVRIPPLAPNGEMVLAWLDHVNDTGLGSSYADFQNRSHSSVCGKDLSTVYLGNIIPHWDEDILEKHWTVPKYSAAASRRGEKKRGKLITAYIKTISSFRL